MKVKTGQTMMMGLAVLLIFFMVGCAEPADQSPGSETKTITDMAGRTVEVPTEVNSVLGLSSTNRFIVYLDAVDKMAGVREMEQSRPYSMPWTMAIKSEIPDIPLFDESDFETIMALEPDLILSCSGDYTVDFSGQEAIQKRTGIPVVITKPYVCLAKNLDNFYETVKIIGDLLGKEERAKELISGVEAIIDDLNERTREIPDEEKPTVYVGGKSWAGSHGLTSTSSYYSAFEFVNAKNVAAEIGEENAFIDPEAIIAWDPDIIFIESAGGLELSLEELKEPKYQSLKAVKNNEVHKIFLKIWNNTNIENVLINAYYVGSVLYPEKFSDIDFAKKADEIYELFLGRPIYDEMVERFGEPGKINLK
ncbi:MAG: ABC transporter substrate-binding protein [Dethiobacteria bacterium]|nr:ABC transporter substrate-binding protein [Bacillota bacterium]HPZ41011.1 ABC transporter substrate-binding protein [Bacillota bacterium]